MLDWETIRLLDDLNPGDSIGVDWYDEDGRARFAAGKYSHLNKDSVGEWCLFLRNRFVGIRMIDVVRIERV